MMLDGQVAIVHGAGGFVGRAVAIAFAAEGARLFLTGRSEARLDLAHSAVREATAGEPEVTLLDLTDPAEVAAHADAVAARAGRIDLMFNAASYGDVQGAPLAEMAFGEFSTPVATAVAVQFHAAQAAARHMIRQRAGVIQTIVGHGPPFPGLGATPITWAVVEAMYRQWACELGPFGIRVAWLRTGGFEESVAGAAEYGVALKVVVGGEAVPLASRVDDATVAAELEELASGTMIGALPSVTEAGHAAAYLASQRARHPTAAAINLTAGAVSD